MIEVNGIVLPPIPDSARPPSANNNNNNNNFGLFLHADAAARKIQTCVG